MANPDTTIQLPLGSLKLRQLRDPRYRGLDVEIIKDLQIINIK
jgi:hypothetical protein